jgi:PBP1b-binding outer membrane lipoprotein LpoB
MKSKHKYLISGLAAVMLSACASSGVVNQSGTSSKYVDVTAASKSSSVGIESNDIVNMTSQMVQSMRRSPALFNRSVAARVLVDDSEFSNEGTSRINKKTITNRLRVGLNHAAEGNLVFVSRQNIARILKERELKRSGTVDQGTIRQTQATAGVDFLLGGMITTLDEVDDKSGGKSRYHHIVFEMLDLELGTIVWTDDFEFKKAGTDDAVYR